MRIVLESAGPTPGAVACPGAESLEFAETPRALWFAVVSLVLCLGVPFALFFSWVRFFVYLVGLELELAEV